MRSLQEFYNEIIADNELKKAFTEAAKDNKIIEFAKEHGVETTTDEIKAFLETQTAQEKELSPEELENAAGGACNKVTKYEAITSYLTCGISCAIIAAISAGASTSEETSYTYYDEERKATYKRTINKEVYVGRKEEEDGRLCNRKELPSEDLIG